MYATVLELRPADAGKYDLQVRNLCDLEMITDISDERLRDFR